MKVVFSRKGFDSSAGGGPSPIVDGRALSLPIPATRGASATTYGNLRLGGHARRASGGRISGRHPCHHDPRFLPDGSAMLGQCGAAQTHLENRGVGMGDVFVFFGLFCEGAAAPHHRIFGYLQVEEVLPLKDAPKGRVAALAELGMPHAIAMETGNDAVWIGRGATNAPACEELRLTVPGGPLTLWQVPPWLTETGLSYHGRADRWLPDHRLQSVSRGQEFVADIGEREDAREWLRAVIAAIES